MATYFLHHEILHPQRALPVRGDKGLITTQEPVEEPHEPAAQGVNQRLKLTSHQRVKLTSQIDQYLIKFLFFC